MHFNQQNEAGLRASYMVSLRVAQEKKPHNIAEKLIVLCCKDIIRYVVGCDAEKKVASIPLSNNIVHQQIVDMSDDVKQQVITELKEAPLGKFSIQLESTDVAACAQLMVFARYISGEDLKENFLFCCTIDSTTRGEDIFNKVSNFFEREELSWNNVCGCTTDGAPSMLGRRSRFQGQVVEKNSKTKHLHCMLHRYALACKTLPPELRLILDDAAVHMINTIKSSSLKTRLFSQLSQELGSDHEALLYHTKVRWLSRGNVIRRVESLNEELSEFFRRDNKTRSVEFIQKLSDSRWLQRLAYLSDILLRLNILNLSLRSVFIQ